jgi:hypothetical protein
MHYYSYKNFDKEPTYPDVIKIDDIRIEWVYKKAHFRLRDIIFFLVGDNPNPIIKSTEFRLKIQSIIWEIAGKRCRNFDDHCMQVAEYEGPKQYVVQYYCDAEWIKTILKYLKMNLESKNIENFDEKHTKLVRWMLNTNLAMRYELTKRKY